jgi:hypothetical protein
MNTVDEVTDLPGGAAPLGAPCFRRPFEGLARAPGSAGDHDRAAFA